MLLVNHYAQKRLNNKKTELSELQTMTYSRLELRVEKIQDLDTVIRVMVTHDSNSEQTNTSDLLQQAVKQMRIMVLDVLLSKRKYVAAVTSCWC